MLTVADEEQWEERQGWRWWRWKCRRSKNEESGARTDANEWADVNAREWRSRWCCAVVWLYELEVRRRKKKKRREVEAEESERTR
jgi:hypothetical protein